jgi:hypothetical protein
MHKEKMKREFISIILDHLITSSSTPLIPMVMLLPHPLSDVLLVAPDHATCCTTPELIFSAI